MTTSIDPSVDELLLLQENQYHRQNYFVLTNVKPIGVSLNKLERYTLFINLG